jgi:hypothetical protein
MSGVRGRWFFGKNGRFSPEGEAKLIVDELLTAQPHLLTGL